MIAIEEGFGPNLRAWRQYRRLSQLDLSLDADISQRHISWLETGRSQPSRQMVLQLSEALEVPLRERNQLLLSAGFAALYRDNALDDKHMGVVRDALRRMLDQQLPYPSLAVDREWNLLMTNAAAEALLAQAGGKAFWEKHGRQDERNLLLFTLHPDGLRPLITNWEEAARHFVQRLRRDRDNAADSDLRDRLQELMALAGDQPIPVPSTPLLPMLTLDVRLGEQVLRLFSVISTFGTAQDVTADELRIESFFPADEASEALLRQFAATSAQ